MIVIRISRVVLLFQCFELTMYKFYFLKMYKKMQRLSYVIRNLFTCLLFFPNIPDTFRTLEKSIKSFCWDPDIFIFICTVFQKYFFDFPRKQMQQHIRIIQGCRNRGVGGWGFSPPVFGQTVILNQGGQGQIMPTTVLRAPRIFRPCDGSVIDA